MADQGKGKKVFLLDHGEVFPKEDNDPNVQCIVIINGEIRKYEQFSLVGFNEGSAEIIGNCGLVQLVKAELMTADMISEALDPANDIITKIHPFEVLKVRRMLGERLEKIKAEILPN